MAWMRAVGSDNPARDLGFVGNYLDGLTLHQLAQPDPQFNPESALVALLTALITLDATIRG